MSTNITIVGRIAQTPERPRVGLCGFFQMSAAWSRSLIHEDTGVSTLTKQPVRHHLEHSAKGAPAPPHTAEPSTRDVGKYTPATHPEGIW
jgi:hypothetical protein